jgi:hypothetical protein
MVCLAPTRCSVVFVLNSSDTHTAIPHREPNDDRYGFATLLSLYNKWMFSPQYYGFSFPLFVTFCHMLVQFALAALVRLVWPVQFRPVERPSRQEYV